MSKEKYEAVKHPKTSEDWDAQAKYLKQQLEAARKAQRAAVQAGRDAAQRGRTASANRGSDGADRVHERLHIEQWFNCIRLDDCETGGVKVAG